MKLRFCKSKIDYWADKYKPTGDKALWENELIQEIKPRVRQLGHLELKDLKTLVKWKSKRRYALVKENCDSDVRHITKCAFLVNDERARIDILTCMRGVAYPIASAILHLFHKDQYPILDARAMWSVKEEDSYYSFSLWSDYVHFCRNIAHCNQVDMRTLDKALWQFSNENQPVS